MWCPVQVDHPLQPNSTIQWYQNHGETHREIQSQALKGKGQPWSRGVGPNILRGSSSRRSKRSDKPKKTKHETIHTRFAFASVENLRRLVWNSNSASTLWTLRITILQLRVQVNIYVVHAPSLISRHFPSSIFRFLTPPFGHHVPK